MGRIVKKAAIRRSELIDCAQKLFYTKGYENCSIKDIVSEAGVAKGTFYHYFDSKTAVLEAVVTQLTQKGLTLAQTIINNPDLSALDKWRQLITSSNQWKLAQKEELLALGKILFHESNLRLHYKIKEAQLQMLIPIYEQLIKQGIDEKTFQSAHPKETAELIIILISQLSTTIFSHIIDPNRTAASLEQLTKKISATETAVEQMLSAAPGSLSIIHKELISDWLSKEPIQGEQIDD